ncbi:hypothetical protein [Bradyrhizobium sp. AS23.2]|uniref:hypothetical protein n=1 Tax=Bradyrhizobium sp. AS23.2 TaxID=1680155 RepID=UPI00093D6097|nr:hypothetical protein [Bradyrhizobium sp. AS23.2]OKO69709.1 hypothetical protein AC630_36260 [Bradyrhizobium sp. AS23.2]
MIGRGLESRIVKLETRTARPDEMLVVWRRPEGDVSEALKGATFAKGDKVICAEWAEDEPLPEPCWYRDRLSKTMPRAEYEQLERTIDRIAQRSEMERNEAGFAPFPTLNEERMKQMTDADLIHTLLGVQT